MSMLAGRFALVTGATSGIGEATARLFVKQGAKVVASGRNVDKLKALKTELGCEYVEGDVAKTEDCRRIVSRTAELMPKYNCLVNVAGVLQGGAFGTPACNTDNLLYNFNANTKGPFDMMSFSVEHLKQGHASSIVNVGSVNGVVSFAGTASYCASKAALEMLTKCAALDLAEHGIRVNGVNPGVVVTELQKRGGLSDEQYEAFLKRSVEVTHPLGKALGRVATADEVADLIAFLASEKAQFITGESVRIDGGRGALGAR
eukprot:TRINITY_DN29200_c0_g1_i1.p1 TRINITY_DN29200_c0_g1~~TRINITY_DN29200_c0_g1_i1.p1  ORF type:complete len:260 (+),score=72.10 TRINITY_DN29200_c0_g1_i1:100-879(+)